MLLSFKASISLYYSLVHPLPSPPSPPQRGHHAHRSSPEADHGSFKGPFKEQRLRRLPQWDVRRQQADPLTTATIFTGCSLQPIFLPATPKDLDCADTPFKFHTRSSGVIYVNHPANTGTGNSVATFRRNQEENCSTPQPFTLPHKQTY